MAIEIRKTASEWYREDQECDILDADGWDRSVRNIEGQLICEGAVKWHTRPITFERYKQKRDKCTITGYMHKRHTEPFSKDYIGELKKGKKETGCILS